MTKTAALIGLAGVVGFLGLAGCGANQAGGQPGRNGSSVESESGQREQRYLRASKELKAAEEELGLIETEAQANIVLIDSLRRQLAGQTDEKRKTELTTELTACTRKTFELKSKIRTQESTIDDLKAKRDAIAAGS